MRTGLGLGLAAWALCTVAMAAVPGPERPLTDPRSIVSISNPAARPVAIPDLFLTRSAAGAVATPDGKTVVFSGNISGRYNLWKVSVGGGAPTPLAQSDERQYGPVISPDGKWVVFQSDIGGNELYDLYAVPLAGGAVVNLTATDDATEQGPIFSADGGMIAYTHKLKTAPQTDIWVMDFNSHKARALTHEAQANQVWSPVAFTADGRSLIANRGDVNQIGSAAWRIDLATGKADKITPGDDHHLVSAADISPDGTLLAITANLQGPQQQAGVLDLKTGKIKWLQPSPWEEGAAAFSPDGRSILYGVNADGRASLRLYDVATGETRALEFPAGVDSPEGQNPFTADGRYVLLGHQASNAPLDYWLAPTGAGAPVQVTHLADASCPPAVLHHRPLRQPGRDGDLGGADDAVQFEAGWAKPGRGGSPRRPHRPDHRHLQPHGSGPGLARLCGDRAQRPRLYRLRQGVPGRQHQGSRRRRSGG